MLFHQSPDMVESKRAMFESAKRRVLLADHTKFERRALHGMGRLDEFDAIIVDANLPSADVLKMRSRGLNVIVAPWHPVIS